MQLTLEHADPHADPHDSIVAQLRDMAPRLAHDPSPPNVSPGALETPAASPDLVSEPSLRATPLNDNAGDIRIPAQRARSGRRVARVLLTVGVGVAVMIAWYSYGEEAKQRLSHLTPQLFASVAAPTPNTNVAEPQETAAQIATPQSTSDSVPAQAAAVVPATPTQSETATAAPAVDSPPAQAALPPELAQSIESMAHEIASLKQTVEQLQAGQQRLSSDIAKVTEHETRRKLVPQKPKPGAALRPQHLSAPAAARRTPTPYSPPPQAYSQGQTFPHGAAQRDAYIPSPAPTQLPPQPGDTSAPRPPMPLR